MSARTRSLGVVAVLSSMASISTAASAATVALDSRCYDYLTGSAMAVSGSGFAANETIDISSTGVLKVVQADANGGFAAAVPVPPLPFAGPGEKAFTLTASSELTGNVATAPFKVANLAVDTKPAHARPSTRVRFSFSGFPNGHRIYGHFLLRGKLRVTKRYGVAKGPCGTLTTKAPLYPGPHPRFGTYHLQFDGSRRYSKRTVPKLLAKLRIFQTFHF